MAIRNIFKKKPKEKPIQKLKEEISFEKPIETKSSKVKEKRNSESWRILKSPHITEKATDLVKKNQYVFKVSLESNKPEIKKTISDLYGVEVKAVKIIKVPAKRRRVGRITGWRKGYKKAIVKIKEGQKIEILPR